VIVNPSLTSPDPAVEWTYHRAPVCQDGSLENLDLVMYDDVANPDIEGGDV
jgi:hypothetical protein